MLYNAIQIDRSMRFQIFNVAVFVASVFDLLYICPCKATLRVKKEKKNEILLSIIPFVFLQPGPSPSKLLI